MTAPMSPLTTRVLIGQNEEQGTNCKHCGTFKSKAFTGEQLGQRCHVCGVGTTWSWDTTTDTFGCEQYPVESGAPAGP